MFLKNHLFLINICHFLSLLSVPLVIGEIAYIEYHAGLQISYKLDDPEISGESNYAATTSAGTLIFLRSSLFLECIYGGHFNMLLKEILWFSFNLLHKS